MRRPVGIFRIDPPPGARVDAFRHLDHGDAVLDRAYRDAEIAGDAFAVDHLEAARAIGRHRDRLMRGVLAGGIAAAAFDAEILIDARLGDVVEIEILPVGDIGHRLADDLAHTPKALLVEPLVEPRDHLLHDLEAIGHRRRAHLNRAGSEQHELGCILPGADAAYA